MKWIFTGPESSGKTTLTNASQKIWGGVVLPEIVRHYEKIDPERFMGEDLIRLAVLQKEAEEKITEKDIHVWCDTDWITLLVWAKERFENVYDSIYKIWQSIEKESRFYFLCSPDMPWEYDEMRQNPTDRKRLFYEYETLLLKEKLPYAILSGNQIKRIETVKKIYDAVTDNSH